MDKDAFCLLCHDFAITLRVLGHKEAAAELRSLEADAANNFGRLFWSPKRAALAFHNVAGLLQDEAADKLGAH